MAYIPVGHTFPILCRDCDPIKPTIKLLNFLVLKPAFQSTTLAQCLLIVSSLMFVKEAGDMTSHPYELYGSGVRFV